MTEKKWQFWIDRGGTFTDVIARHPDGALSNHKYLSENPELYRDAAVYAMRDIMAVGADAPFPAGDVEAIKMGTTVATNALLEREGEPTALVVTKGFRDALLIGQQHRPDLFAMKPQRPAPLYDHVIEVNERVMADGTVHKPLQEGIARDLLKQVYTTGLRSIAICLMHGYRFTDHEKHLAKIARDIGFTQISVSHEISPLMKFIPRGDTSLADAYLSPILMRYVAQVREAVGDTPLYFMQSNGGLASADAFGGKDAVLSGPAGGIVGAARSGERAGASHILGFDMGGTSTDVSHYAGSYERVLDSTVAGVRISVPMMDIHTVAAGGGSICQFKDGRFQVGPQSAGANPGPAAYGRGGPITVTDCNVLLGKLQPDLFPCVFGPDGDQPLNRAAAVAGFQKIATQIKIETGETPDLKTIAEGFLAVAVEHMARAIKRVSVERGHDIKHHALLTFGGAGGQHACLVADALGITKVVIPPFSGVLSALGMGLAEQTTIAEETVESQIQDTASIEKVLNRVKENAQNRLEQQGIPKPQQIVSVHAALKYAGSDSSINIPHGPADEMASTFTSEHQRLFGFTSQDTDILVESIDVEATSCTKDSALQIAATGTTDQALYTRQIFMAGDNHDASIYQREALKPNHKINGPAVILENGGTTLVEPGWQAVLDNSNTLFLVKVKTTNDVAVDTGKPDPIMLEVFNNLFMSVAEEMGGVLAQTARSVNIKERLDFSCAVFDTDGNLIANAPHMPVHLGSMGESVKAIVASRGNSVTDGDVFMVNDPYAGGTHLPDITVVTPVFLEGLSTPQFFVASRGHHADVGGISPGSMPPHSKSIEEEGIRFTNFHLVKAGIFAESDVRAALATKPYPARNPDQNIADLKAQVAANQRGISAIKKLVSHFGAETVSAYMVHVQDNAEEAVRRVIATLQNGAFCYSMDCGGTINVTVTVDQNAREAVVDFTGSSNMLDSNFNAPLAVTKAAVLYVFRTLTGSDIPLNAGCLIPIKLVVPEGCMLNPLPPAAVVAGNVETSQAVTNALFLAVGACAAAQGTMNNLTFGNDTYQYYETIAGGTGAGPGFDGTDVIQSHMTNSRLTDPEVLEWRYPVLLEEFSVRENSGGKGKWHGGNGGRRALTFLEDMEVAILSGHRKNGPPGLSGGEAGDVGQTFIIRDNNSEQNNGQNSVTRTILKPADHTNMKKGDTITVETPGGGGYDHY